MLAIITPPILILISIAYVIGFLFLLPKLKKSKGIEKLSDGLFKEPVKNTVNDAIDSIKEGKDVLVEKTKDNAKKVADIAKEQLKINKNQ